MGILRRGRGVVLFNFTRVRLPMVGAVSRAAVGRLAADLFHGRAVALVLDAAGGTEGDKKKRAAGEVRRVKGRETKEREREIRCLLRAGDVDEGV